ncbi:MAG: metallophosphoesterase [Bacteroidetes bacterium]|nr:metallophosphoesterase [Bacteroidota bacterium]
MHCFFVTDLHGKIDRYHKLFNTIRAELPEMVFFGGDLLPHGLKPMEGYDHFATDFLFPELLKLKNSLREKYPAMMMILGNDDARSEESYFQEQSNAGLIQYINESRVEIKDLDIFGYSFVPPTPFQLKDWEKYDVSRFADPGCVHPTEGFRTVEPPHDTEYSTIQKDLENLTEGKDLSRSVFLFHSPPYQTNLDRAALDGRMVDHVPMDVHVGSIAIQRFIEKKQPLVTLHGHIHESTRLTSIWKETLGNTWMINGAHDGPELALVSFDTEEPEKATRRLI